MGGDYSKQWIKLVQWVLTACLVFVGPAPGQQTNQIPLWPAGAPFAQGAGPDDTPAVLLYLPSSQQPTPAILICPSDNYASPFLDSRWLPVAEWLNDLGIAAFVLKYRLAPAYHYPVPLLDAQRALALHPFQRLPL